MSKPLFSVDRVRWNRTWEEKLAKIYGLQDTPFYPGPSVIDGARLKATWDISVASDSYVQSVNTMVKEASILQRDLSREASRRFAEDDFESRWKSCSSETREEWILEGLVRTCEASPDFEERRRFCPEVTLSRLNKRNGQPFLDLLQALCLEDIDSVPTNPKSLPSEWFDRMIGHNINVQNRGRQLLQLMELTKRTYFLVMFVWNVLLAFHGESETFGVQKTESLSQARAGLRETAKVLGLKKETLKDLKAQVRASQQQAEHNCQNCRLPASRIEGVTTLSTCAKCKSIGRYVYYCGRSCQVNDYKNGNPPHKQLCGNKNALLEATLSPSGSEKATSNTRWPVPQAGYTRSPALQHQLRLIEEDSRFHYVFVRPYPEDDIGVVLYHPMGQVFFELCMERAITSHSPVDVYRMYQTLEDTARKTSGFGVEKLKEQLKREYRVDIDELRKVVE